MTDSNLNAQLISSYLQQQMNLTMPHDASTSLSVVKYPSGLVLDEFKDAVRAFIEIDTTIKKLRIMLKERMLVKGTLSAKISAFMTQYKIDDLNTEHGKIRYKLKTTKVGLSKIQIKEKLTETESGRVTVQDIHDVFSARLEKTRQVLQRLKRN